MTDVTVIGLGAMGSALANAFLDKGHSVTVWNRTSGKAGALIAKGAREAQTISDAVGASRLIVVCLLTYDTVETALQPASKALAGRALVNLTNGTPAQARKFAEWASARHADYLDGGIMAIPPMIGRPEALILYSGLGGVFDDNRKILESLGRAQYFGADAGLAALYDLALLTGMYGLFSGAIQATALIGTESVTARDFMPLLTDWLNAMMGALPNMAEQVDSRDYTLNVVSNLAMQAAAYPNLVEANIAQGLSTELMAPMGEVMRKAVTAGYGNGDLSSLVEVIRQPAA
jgi:3-hydroxyisobutyrate dehydrogenase-like beta-hydroxyacid dehydrogenase